MNLDLKKMVLENEHDLLIAFPEYKTSIQFLIKKIEKINYDAILFEFLKSSFQNPQKQKQIKSYHSKGFLSSLEIVMNNIDSLDLMDKPSIQDLKEGEKYNSYDISCLGNNYNIQVGMYFIDENNVIIKSTVEDNDRPYDDRWIEKNVILRYFMQSENDLALRTLIFSKKPNIAIFNALMEGRLINVYTFVNKKKGEDYIYQGVFHPCGLICNNKAFILFKDGHDDEVPFDNFDGQFILSLLRNSVEYYPSKKELTRIESIEYNHKEVIKIRRSKRNRIQQQKIELEVELRGEDLVLNYEKNMLNSLGYPELAKMVKNVTLTDESLGYDIKSFEIDEKGEVKDTYIKVKSSVSGFTNPFVLKKQEIDKLRNGDGHYKFYRVFDIYTDFPKLNVMNEPFDDLYIFETDTYRVTSKC